MVKEQTKLDKLFGLENLGICYLGMVSIIFLIGVFSDKLTFLQGALGCILCIIIGGIFIIAGMLDMINKNLITYFEMRTEE